MKILIAEDNVVMSHVLRFNLTRTGKHVVVAENGSVALQAARRDKFGLVISDYQIPVMNGLDFCRRLRKLNAYRDVPLILCSAKGYEIDEARLREELGIAAVVFKPFSPREITELVDELMAARV
jgi:CheY-like chemotaxis protein